MYWLRHGCEAGETRASSFHDVFPEFEISNVTGVTCTLDRFSDLPRPFHFKSHLNASFFKRFLDNHETCPKFIVVMCNVKDVIVSFYHLHQYLINLNFKGRTFDEFFEKFQEQTIYMGDPIVWWKYKDHPNVHILFTRICIATRSNTYRQLVILPVVPSVMKYEMDK